MKKVVRLTESDLTRLIKKILNEEQVNYTSINPPISLKINVKDRKNIVNFANVTVTSKKPNMIGYFLRLDVKGSPNVSEKAFVYSCFHRNKIFYGDDESSFGGTDFDTIQDGTHKKFANLTPQGDSLLYNKLGCGNYVLNKNNNSSDDYLV